MVTGHTFDPKFLRHESLGQQDGPEQSSVRSWEEPRVTHLVTVVCGLALVERDDIPGTSLAKHGPSRPSEWEAEPWAAVTWPRDALPLGELENLSPLLNTWGSSAWQVTCTQRGHRTAAKSRLVGCPPPRAPTGYFLAVFSCSLLSCFCFNHLCLGLA